MIQTLNIKGTIINLDFETQISKLGRPFRLSGVRLCIDEPPIWVDKVLTHKTIYDFKYLDDGSFFSFQFDQHNNFEKKV